MSTKIKENQADRQLYQALGTTTADVAGAGFAASGSALDILRSSAQQGATTRAVLGMQGRITEAGYAEQARSYTNMAKAAGIAIQEDQLAAKAATTASDFAFASAGVSALAGVFGFSSGGGAPNLTPPTAGDWYGVGGWGPATIG